MYKPVNPRKIGPCGKSGLRRDMEESRDIKADFAETWKSESRGTIKKADFAETWKSARHGRVSPEAGTKKSGLCRDIEE
jgi:hypothetical protein